MIRSAFTPPLWSFCSSSSPSVRLDGLEVRPTKWFRLCTIRLDACRPPADEFGPCLARASPETVEALPVGANVHVQDRHVVHAVVHGLIGVLDGIHAAESRAVAEEAAIARADAEHEEDILGMLAVGRPNDLAIGGAGRVEQALKLQPREDVRMRPVAVFFQSPRVHRVVPYGHDNGPHLPRHSALARHHEVNALRPTDPYTVIARDVVGRIVQAVGDVDHVFAEDRLRDRCVDGLARGHS